MKLSEVLTDESKWCKELLGVLPDGTACESHNLQDAAKHCLLGALMRIYPHDCEERTALRDKICAAHKKLFYDRTGNTPDSVMAFNDHPDTTFADVQAVIKEVESN